MILKLTFNDNDFTRHIEEFLDKCYTDPYIMMWELLEPYKNGRESIPIEEYCELSENYRSILNAFYEDDDKPTKEHKEAFIQLIKKCFIQGFENRELHALDYLKEHFEVTEVNSVKSKWQNGEVVYWFVSFHSYVTM